MTEQRSGGRDAEESERRSRQWRYQKLHAQLRAILNRHDPIGLIAIGAPVDEYEPELARIMPRLETVGTTEELTDAIHAIFVEMFDAESAGPRSHYEPISRAIWSEVRGR